MGVATRISFVVEESSKPIKKRRFCLIKESIILAKGRTNIACRKLSWIGGSFAFEITVILLYANYY